MHVRVDEAGQNQAVAPVGDRGLWRLVPHVIERPAGDDPPVADEKPSVGVPNERRRIVTRIGAGVRERRAKELGDEFGT